MQAALASARFEIGPDHSFAENTHIFSIDSKQFKRTMNDLHASSSRFLSKYKLSIPSEIERLAIQKESRNLEANYEPLECDVVCGRGKGSYNRPGNKNFRSLVSSFIPEYIQSKSKVDKTRILNSIIDRVRAQHDFATGRSAQFIKYSKSEGWIEIGDEQAREKVGHAIREAMASQGVSSDKRKGSKSKASAAKRIHRVEKPVQTEAADEVFSSCEFDLFQAPLLPVTVGSRSSFTAVFDEFISI